MKKLILILVVVVLLVIGTYSTITILKGRGNTNFGGKSINETTLIGSSTNLQSLPIAGVFANTTTTDAANATDQLEDGGAVLTQKLYTNESDFVLLNIRAIGGTVTSTVFIRQMGSYDGTNYFDIASSTDVYKNLVGTTTITAFVKAFEIDPGTATTTGISIPFYTEGFRHTRFIIWGEDLSTDPADGVQAWITANIIDNY